MHLVRNISDLSNEKPLPKKVVKYTFYGDCYKCRECDKLIEVETVLIDPDALHRHSRFVHKGTSIRIIPAL
jgi:hypothetical protein